MTTINIADPTYFYDDRNKYDYFYKLKTILYLDDEVCLCVVEPFGVQEGEEIPEEKLLFNMESGEVINSEFDSWLATNDNEWIWGNIEQNRND